MIRPVVTESCIMLSTETVVGRPSTLEPRAPSSAAMELLLGPPVRQTSAVAVRSSTVEGTKSAVEHRQELVRNGTEDIQVFDKTSFDSCCERNNRSFEAYSSQRQFCCDGAQPKNANLSCCYIRDALGKATPQSYNFQSLCCRYPYDRLYSKNIDGTCT